MKPASRAGLSLLEVLLATSILLGCVVVLAELANIGRKHAETAEDLAAAQLLCQTRLNEMLTGISPVAPVERKTLEEMPGWLLSVDIEPVDRPGLSALRVTVAQDVAEDQRPRQFTLVRWIRDPHRRSGTDTDSSSADDSESQAGSDGGPPP